MERGRRGGEAGVHTHYRSEQEKKRECMEIQGLNFSSWAFLKERGGGQGYRLRQYSVGPVWLSAASRSVLIHTVSIILPTPGGHNEMVNLWTASHTL